MKITLKIYAFIFFTILQTSHVAAKTRIAIIGSGIKGALCSYYLRKTIRNVDDLKIDIYDHFTYKQRKIPLHIHENHKYMREIIKENDIRIDSLYGSSTPLIYDGLYNYPLNIEVFKQIAPRPLEELSRFIQSSYENFEKIYDWQERGNSYETVQDLLNSVNPELTKYMKKSTKTLVNENTTKNQSNQNMKLKLFLEAILMRDYGQNFKTHALAGLISLWFSEITGKMHRIITDYDDVVNILTIGSNLKKTTVASIMHQNKLNLVFLNNQELIFYDFVIIADHNNIKNIHISGYETINNYYLEYEEVFQTQFRGTLKKNSCGSQLENCQNSIPVVLNIKDLQVYGKSYNDNTYWGALSPKELQKSSIEKIFDISQPLALLLTKTHHFPKYSDFSNANKSNFVLRETLYYVNAIEWANPSIEILAIGGLNVALLIEKAER